MIRILHLYPNLMNLYGDYGNLKILVRHLEDQGQKVAVDRKEVNETVSFFDYDLIYMGSGTEKNLLVALEELKKYELMLRSCIENDKVILLTGNAMELLGKKIDEHEGLGIIDFSVTTSEKRHTGDVIVNSLETGPVVGFINRSTVIEGDYPEKLFEYEFRDANLPDNGYEGYRYRNLIGTHIIGPVLVKNPGFLKMIVRLLVPEELSDIDYEHEEKAYETTLRELRKRK